MRLREVVEDYKVAIPPRFTAATTPRLTAAARLALVVRLAIAAGGFTPGEADQLRRAMAAWRKQGEMEKLSARLIDGPISNGIEPCYAKRIFEQIQGFGEYGFPERTLKFC